MNVVRIACRTGFSAVRELLGEYWAATIGEVPDVELCRMESTAMLSLCSPTTAWFLVHDDENVHGFASVGQTEKWKNGGPVFRIFDFYVPPRSSGTTNAAYLLYNEVMRWSKSCGCKDIGAQVALTNSRVVSLLSSFGFSSEYLVMSKEITRGRSKRSRRRRHQKLEARDETHQGGCISPGGDRGGLLCESSTPKDPKATERDPQQSVHVQ